MPTPWVVAPSQAFAPRRLASWPGSAGDSDLDKGAKVRGRGARLTGVADAERVGVEERYAVFPFYLCLDVSASMAGAPAESVNAQLPLLRAGIGDDPAIAEVIRLGVVTFSDAAH